MTDLRRTVLDVPADADVELVWEDCSCARGTSCSDADAFAPACPRRKRYLVMRGTAEGARYVRKLLPDIGTAEWTADRGAAHPFRHRSEAAYVQGCIVAHDGGSAAVVPVEV